jgi:hypothetical protein
MRWRGGLGLRMQSRDAVQGCGGRDVVEGRESVA